MQKLVALKRLYYNRRDYDVGEKFEADDRFAKAVVLIGKAKVDDSKPAKASAPVAPTPTPPPPAPPPLDTNSAADLVPNKRRYNRRDMAATEDGEESS